MSRWNQAAKSRIWKKFHDIAPLRPGLTVFCYIRLDLNEFKLHLDPYALERETNSKLPSSERWTNKGIRKVDAEAFWQIMPEV
jgi:hypothetical protein